MKLGEMRTRLVKYHDRLSAGRAHEIKPGHVRKVLAKLEAKEASLLADLDKVESDERRERLFAKLGTTRELIARARWLLGQV